MAEAIALAMQGYGLTSPNPIVGAVVVKDDRIVGRGFHPAYGAEHAEVYALRDAGSQAQGGTLYVTLEPCSSEPGENPEKRHVSCVKQIISSGITQVIYGASDPNPAHAGRADVLLKQAGIAVKSGVAKEECQALNRSFFHWITTRKPFVRLKMAMTLDGKIATSNGNSQWITGTEARERVQYLRRGADGIMVSGRTVRLDHPKLTIRTPENWGRQPAVIVLSNTMTLETLQRCFPQRKLYLFSPGTPEEWQEMLLQLGREKITSLFIEGGGELAAAALQNKIVNEVEFHIAPKLLCGRESIPVLGGKNPVSLAEALSLQHVTMGKLGNDFYINGLLMEN